MAKPTKTGAKAAKKTAGKAKKRPAGNDYAKALSSIPPDILAALQAARGPKEALKKFEDTPELWILYNAIQSLIAAVNTQIPSLFTKQNINMFGLANNHLDPLNFNGYISAGASKEFCLPQECSDIFGVEVCFPPWVPCVRGEADARLDSLTGLSGMVIELYVLDEPSVKGDIISTTGSFVSYMPQLRASGAASASGGPSGFSIPVSASGSATITGLVATAKMTVSCNLKTLKVTALTIDELTLGGSFHIDVSIDGLGPFDSLVGGLTFHLTMLLAANLGFMGSSTQPLADALKDALQGVINSQL